MGIGALSLFLPPYRSLDDVTDANALTARMRGRPVPPSCGAWRSVIGEQSSIRCARGPRGSR